MWRDFFKLRFILADNRRKIQRKRAKTMDYTALVKRPVKGSMRIIFIYHSRSFSLGPSISPQLKVAVFQYLSTSNSSSLPSSLPFFSLSRRSSIHIRFYLSRNSQNSPQLQHLRDDQTSNKSKQQFNLSVQERFSL